MIDRFIEYICSTRTPITVAGAYDRWFVWPRNRFFNCYLHGWFASDREDLHDHRMMNVSVILKGSYSEDRFLSKPIPGKPLPGVIRVSRRRLVPYFRLPSTPHRVVLDGTTKCWSLFIGFPHWREWGFWTEKDRAAKWVSFKDIVSDTDPTSPGYGVRR